ncbi:MAG: sodium:proline symporter [Verrucomicrobiae bacterium]|nr:sodium:proline symporter [Verrucomicrobiae bacterium]
MTWIDWLIIVVPLGIVSVVAAMTQRYVKGVADFMAGNRCAGRYLIANARGEMGMAVVSTVAGFEVFYQAGFTMGFWEFIRIPVSMFIGLLGFVIYRYRETRAMTLSQFFEIRYSRNFRIFSGLMAFLSGLINYGIFPAVAARFFVYFCGFPFNLSVAGMILPTFAVIMAFYLAFSLTMTLVGGQLTIMVTDCLEGILSLWMYWVVIIVLMVMFSWSEVYQALSTAPPGKSLMNPFDCKHQADFNIGYILIGLLTGIYSTMAWQGGHAFNSSAANAHEAKMAGIVAGWRGFGKGLFIALLSLAAYTFLTHPDFAPKMVKVNEILNSIDNPQITNQMRMPVALGVLLPVGVKGLVCSLFLLGLIACDSSYLHSWGSIFVQDVMVPLRRTPMSPKRHILALRLAIFGVAVFGFFFSLFFRQTDYILMFFALTGAIYVGGAGSAIIGGLYWKKGTTGAAWAAMITGSTLAGAGILCQQGWTWIQPRLISFFEQGDICDYLVEHATKFPINGIWMNFFAILVSVTVYVIISLLTCKKDFNMEQMLHRGAYGIASEHKKEDPRGFQWGKLIGIDANFTKADRAISISVFSYKMFWFLAGFIMLAWNLISRWPLQWWSVYWYIHIIIPLILGPITTIWFTWGGIRDLRQLFQTLRIVKRDSRDDGTVVNHHNLDEPREVK